MHQLRDKMHSAGVGHVSDDEQPSVAVAPRLVWLRNQLGKVLDNLETVHNTIVAEPPQPADEPPGNQDSDLIGVLRDCEALANKLGEVANQLSSTLGSVDRAVRE